VPRSGSTPNHLCLVCFCRLTCYTAWPHIYHSLHVYILQLHSLASWYGNFSRVRTTLLPCARGIHRRFFLFSYPTPHHTVPFRALTGDAARRRDAVHTSPGLQALRTGDLLFLRLLARHRLRAFTATFVDCILSRSAYLSPVATAARACIFHTVCFDCICSVRRCAAFVCRAVRYRYWRPGTDLWLCTQLATH